MPENPDYWGFKSYEPYYLITAQSVQLCLQYDAVTDSNGFRLFDGRYLVAVGTFCNAPCGTYIDLILENGVLIRNPKYKLVKINEDNFIDTKTENDEK